MKYQETYASRFHSKHGVIVLFVFHYHLSIQAAGADSYKKFGYSFLGTKTSLISTRTKQATKKTRGRRLSAASARFFSGLFCAIQEKLEERTKKQFGFSFDGTKTSLISTRTKRATSKTRGRHLGVASARF